MTRDRRPRSTARAVPAFILVLVLALALALAACGDDVDAASTAAGDDAEQADNAETGDDDDGSAADDAGDGAAGTVTVEHASGTDEVPVNPDTVVALANPMFSTLAAMGVELAAAPVSLMGDGSIWPEYADVDDVGNHREPNLEVVIAANPDLIITGGRFGQYYEDLVSDNPDAVVIDLSIDAEGEISDDLKRYTEVLGQIFDDEATANEIINAYDDAVADAQVAYNGDDTVMGLITSGASIQYAAPVEGRSVGPVFGTLDLVPAMDREAEDASHGDEVSVEAIADANPDWIIALDRDGAVSPDDPEYASAEEVIEGSEALQNTTAVAERNVVYLDRDFYLTEDIQAYTDLYADIAEAFSAS